MEEIIKKATEGVFDYEYNPKNDKPSSNKLKHQIIYFEWTIRLIREFIWMPIAWVSLKLFKNPEAAKKSNGEKKQEQIPNARIMNKSIKRRRSKTIKCINF